MSIRLMTAAWAVQLPDSEKLVLLALADCANDEGGCWPSMASLVAKCSKSDRTIQACIKALVQKGHIERDENPGKGCFYTVHPRSDNTPEAITPPKPLPPTPEAASDKPSRTIKIPQKATPSSVKRSSKSKVVPFRLPEDWKPTRFTDGTVAREVIDRRGIEWGRAALERFRNWAANAADKPGIGRKTDWQAAWANWVIEQDRRDGQQRGRTANDDGLGKTARASLVAFPDATFGRPPGDVAAGIG